MGQKPVFFPVVPQAGKASPPGFAEALKRIAFALENLDILGGIVEWAGFQPTIIPADYAGDTGEISPADMGSDTLSANGFRVRGTRALFKVVMLRAYYQSDDSLVDVEVAYDEETMYLWPTWDFPRVR